MKPTMDSAKLIDASTRKVGAISNECSRYQFTYDFFKHPKGSWLHYFAKQFVIKSVSFLRDAILRHYDENAYVFQDPRLFYIKKFTSEFFASCMEERKQSILNKCIDIALFVLKEDVFYRCAVIDMIVKWCREYEQINIIMADQPGWRMAWTGNGLYDLDDVERTHWDEWKGK